MTVKSILEIDVQDDKFREFNALFERYRENLSTLPGQWGIIAKGTGQAADVFDALSRKHAAAIVTGRIDEAAKRRAAEIVKRMDRDALTGVQRIRLETQAWGAAVGKVAGQWKGIGIGIKDAARGIAGATTSLLKWTSLTGVFSALLGAGGLFGIDRLAASAAAGRRSASGLGVRYGQQRAFSLDYGRFVDADAMLANVSGALSDKTSKGYVGLLSAGISSKFTDTHDAADVSVEVLKRLPEIFKGVSPGLIGTTAQARGLTDILSVEDIKRYLAASPEERKTQEDAYRRDSKGLDVDGATTRAWQDLTTQLGRASEQIETTFVKGLVPLVGPIDYLSAAFADLTAAFLKSDVVKNGITALASGLEGAAKFVGTQEFKDDVKGFVDDIGKLARAIRDAVKWIGDKFSSQSSQDKAEAAGDTPDQATAHANNWGVFEHSVVRGHRSMFGMGPYADKADPEKSKARLGEFKATSARQQANAFAITDELRKAGVPDEGIAASLGSAQTESGLNPAVPENNYNRGHHGLWQWDPTRWAKVSKWITDQGGDPMDARWQTKAHIAEGRAKPGDPIYDSPQTSEGFHKLETSKGDLGRAVEGMQGIERFGRGEEGGRAANAGQWLGHLPAASPSPVAGDSPEVAAARKYLAATASGPASQRPDSIVDLNPAFALKAAEAVRQAREAGMKDAGIFSGYRKPTQTGSAYDAQGFSGHSYGLASDFGGIGSPGSPESRKFDEITQKLGLGGYGPDNPREWNHKELGSHLQSDPARLSAMRATLGPDGSMVDPAKTWAASGYAVQPGSLPKLPEVAKAPPDPLEKRTLAAYIGLSGGKPGKPMGDSEIAPPPPKTTAASPVGSVSAPPVPAPSPPNPVGGDNPSAARKKTLPNWMSAGPDGPIMTVDHRDPKYSADNPFVKAAKPLEQIVKHLDAEQQHMANLRLVWKSHIKPEDRFSFAGKLKAHQIDNFVAEARRKAAKDAEGLPKAAPAADSHGGGPSTGRLRRVSGLSDDRFQRRPMPHVLVQNNTGANVNVTAAMAGATVGYG